MAKPIKIGLTGSIGMGKTETAKLFARLGIPVHDADAAVHRLYDTGGLAVEPLAKLFPKAISGGKVDRAALAKCVTGDEAAFQRLEAVVHPLVGQERAEFLAAHSGADMVVFDIPLLFETRAQNEVDVIVVASAPAHIQRERVLARPAMTLEKLEAIHARQVSDQEKRAQADFVIETADGIDQAFTQVKRVVEALKSRRRDSK